jgi:hypothetical protein
VNVWAAFALLTTTAYAQEATIQAQPCPSFTNDCPVPAGLIPGSGPGLARSDCYVELKVVGIDFPGPDVSGGRVVSCTDGDPCDTDGECGNGSCTFSVAVCINQTDPNLPACQPPTGLQKLFVNPPKLAGAVPGSLDGPACGSFVAIPLPLMNGTQPAKVLLSANATAAQGTSPRTDRDTYVLKCLPRTTPCPTTSTTTTTTSTTTTTTLCMPDCGGRTCGDDGCGGSCGDVCTTPGQVCGNIQGDGQACCFPPGTMNVCTVDNFPSVCCVGPTGVVGCSFPAGSSLGTCLNF